MNNEQQGKLTVIPLGGLGEIGKNMMILDSGRDIIAIDAGLMFPEEDMLGVDLVIPNVEYLVQHRDRVRAIFITHGHEDHIGALPFVLPQINVPVYGTQLSLGLIRVKLKERRLLDSAELVLMRAGEHVEIGDFDVRFFHVNHSIPDAVGLIIDTPQGLVVHTGDFKFDHTPIWGGPSDFAALADAGSRGVRLLMSDSTYVERPGHTPSERVVSAAFERIFATAPGRIIVASFASLISRIQQVIDAAAKTGRRVYVIGRSMTDNVQMAVELGYLTPPPEGFLRLDQLKSIEPSKAVICTTGSQGEPTSVLSRIANGEHRQVQLVEGDTVIISATPIPGNEHLVNRTIDNLYRRGARVIHVGIDTVHVPGHAGQEEQKLMINLTRPEFFVPIHGEYRHMVQHARLAQTVGMPPERTFVLQNGDVLELDEAGARVTESIQAGYVYVDGLGVGDIGHVVLRDRQRLANDGVVVAILSVDKRTGVMVGRPDIASRGFVHQDAADDLFEAARSVLAGSLDHGMRHVVELGYLHGQVKDVLSQFFYEQTKRRPMILPVVVEV